MRGRLGALIVILPAFLCSSAAGASNKLNGLTWQDGYEAGSWGCDFQRAKAYAKSANIPLVTVWANPGCGFCGGLSREEK